MLSRRRWKRFPTQSRYLAAPSDRTTLWRSRLGTKRKTRMACPVGSPGTVNDIQRSMPLKLLLPIIGENAEWYSLQKHVRERDRDAFSATPAIINHAETFTDFSDTAAIIRRTGSRNFGPLRHIPSGRSNGKAQSGCSSRTTRISDICVIAKTTPGTRPHDYSASERKAIGRALLTASTGTERVRA